MEHLRRPGQRTATTGSRIRPSAASLLDAKLLPLVRYYAYVQVADEDQNLWEEYTRVRDSNVNFAMQKIVTPAQIFPVFRDLFKKNPIGAA
jgi:uncharacterized sporulation protein YeaH/YhbH (DUF444 family)